MLTENIEPVIMTATTPVRSRKDNTPSVNSNFKNLDNLWFFSGQALPDSGILAPHRRGG
jgi:hypothetical protein